ncbi:hypothetical protein [Streptosporangium amethystogenes]
MFNHARDSSSRRRDKRITIFTPARSPGHRQFSGTCVRCPVLIMGPGERPRLEATRENLRARIAEAERGGWLGDVEQLTVSLAATDDKISLIDANERWKNSSVFVGMPPTSQLTVRETENRDETD